MTAKRIFNLILFFSLLIVLTSAVYARDTTAPCNFFGEIVYSGAFYCNESLDSVQLKADGSPCVNAFECKNGSCLDNICSAGYQRQIEAKRSYLDKIMALLQGELPAGVKKLNASTTGIFNSSEIMGSSANSPVSSVEIEVTEATQVSVSYEDLGYTKPEEAGVTKDAPGIVFKYMEIATPEAASESIKSAKFLLSIPKSWFDTNNANNEGLGVYRWNDDQWSKLVSTKESETADRINYQVITPGFSVFAVTASASGAGTGTPTCSDGIQNQAETGIDCGGPCPECPKTCGNGAVETGENCQNCALDAGCAAGEECKYRQCIKKSFPFWIILLAFVFGAIILFIGFKKIKNVSESKRKQLARLSSAISYVADAARAGEKEENIKNNLLKAGWSNSQTALALKEGKKRLK